MGVVDKPGANLVVRLLEIAELHIEELKDIRKKSSLRGVTDLWIFEQLLTAGRAFGSIWACNPAREQLQG